MAWLTPHQLENCAQSIKQAMPNDLSQLCSNNTGATRTWIKYKKKKRSEQVELCVELGIPAANTTATETAAILI